MRRLVIWTIAGVLFLNLVGISIIYINFINFNKEIEKTILVNKSLFLRIELFEKFQSFLKELEKGNKDAVMLLANEINLKFPECYACHHRDDTLARITAAKSLFERTSGLMKQGKVVRRADIKLVADFITYAFWKVMGSAATQTQSIEFFLGEIKRFIALTIGLTLITFLFFSYHVIRKGTNLEAEIKEKERVITDWALEWQNTFDTMQDMIIILDEEHKPLIFNSAAAEFFGNILFSKNELFKILALDPSDIGGYASRTVQIKDKRFSLRLYPLGEAGRRCIIVLRDITKELELEDKVKRAERLSALGLLSAGIAHEINNPLSPIIGYSEILYELEKDDQKRGYIKQIISAAQRIEGIVKDMLFFAKEQSLKITSEKITEVIDGVIDALKGFKSLRDIEIIKEFNYTGTVNLDKALFEIALLNILKNAVQAIEEAKKGDTVRIATFKEDNLIKITVSDNGPGIPEKILPHIFDPFFTTKEVKKGTGLGLSMTHRIIIAHKGDISVLSAEGEGTTFTITIPA